MHPAAIKYLPTAFDIRRYPDGLRQIAQATDAGAAYLKNASEYGCVATFRDAFELLKNGDAARSVCLLHSLEGTPIRQGAAFHLRILRMKFQLRFRPAIRASAGKMPCV